MSYRHGTYATEVANAITSPLNGTAGLIVAVGTAPVHLLSEPNTAVNTPILVKSVDDARAKLGWSEDFEKYTLCEAVSAALEVAGVAPVVCINVLDPAKHTESVDEKTLPVNKGVAVLEEDGVLLGELKVKKEENDLTAGTDYTVAFNEDGTVSIVLLSEGAGKDATELKVSGKKLAPSAVTAADIVGAYNAESGAETGLEVVRQVYPKLGLVPGILIAPRYSADSVVCAALQAKTHAINGTFSAVCVADVDSTSAGAKKYTDVKAQKEKQGLTDANAYAVWLYGKVGEKVYSGSALAAAVTAYTDAANDDTPNASPSNKSVGIDCACLADGTEMLLDQEWANTVNGYGVATLLRAADGFKLWGNNTAAYPATTEAKDRWFACRRFIIWRGNSFILTYFERVDSPMNKRLIEAIVDSENVRGNGYVARGVCARDEITYDEEENTEEDLLGGTIKFRHYLTPYPPAEVIEDRIEFDPEALKTALA